MELDLELGGLAGDLARAHAHHGGGEARGVVVHVLEHTGAEIVDHPVNQGLESEGSGAVVGVGLDADDGGETVDEVKGGIDEVLTRERRGGVRAGGDAADVAVVAGGHDEAAGRYRTAVADDPAFIDPAGGQGGQHEGGAGTGHRVEPPDAVGKGGRAAARGRVEDVRTGGRREIVAEGRTVAGREHGRTAGEVASEDMGVARAGIGVDHGLDGEDIGADRSDVVDLDGECGSGERTVGRDREAAGADGLAVDDEPALVDKARAEGLEAVGAELEVGGVRGSQNRHSGNQKGDEGQNEGPPVGTMGLRVRMHDPSQD